jgi:hypothetical protein
LSTGFFASRFLRNGKVSQAYQPTPPAQEFFEKFFGMLKTAKNTSKPGHFSLDPKT